MHRGQDRRHDQRAPEPDIGDQRVGDIGTDGQKPAMGEIDHARQVEDERQAKRHQGIERADDQAVENVEQNSCGHVRTPSATFRWRAAVGFILDVIQPLIARTPGAALAAPIVSRSAGRLRQSLGPSGRPSHLAAGSPRRSAPTRSPLTSWSTLNRSSGAAACACGVADKQRRHQLVLRRRGKRPVRHQRDFRRQLEALHRLGHVDRLERLGLLGGERAGPGRGIAEPGARGRHVAGALLHRRRRTPRHAARPADSSTIRTPRSPIRASGGRPSSGSISCCAPARWNFLLRPNCTACLRR